jgi:hypothetical protein
MASSPTEPESAVAFALQEVATCWNQAYEALTQGDVDRIAALMAIAGDHVAVAGDGSADSAAERALRQQAQAAFGRLQHGIAAGLDGLAAELQQSRQGAKALRGYAGIGGTPASRLDRDG